ncbi:hypothetical protein N658DRAFT_427482, partial [Parathielavia hyrcaniae]
ACQTRKIGSPAFQIVSDRRGGRTAWSSQVTIHGKTYSARFWYDGKNLNNAKEDAAEVALQAFLKKPAAATSASVSASVSASASRSGSSAASSPATSRSGWSR